MTDATQYSALIAIRNVIRGMSLEGIDTGRITDEPVAFWNGKEFPFISVSIYESERLPTSEGGGGNLADNIELSYLVAMVAAKEDEAVMYPRILRWRELILGKFHNQRPITAAVSEVYHTTVSPMAVFDKRAYLESSLLVSGLKIVAHTQKLRQS